MCRWVLLMWVFSTVMVGSTSSPVSAEPPEDKSAHSTQQVSADDIAHWVEQLGHDQYLRREMATQKLIQAGPEVIPSLISKIRGGELEIVERATKAITQITLARSPLDDGGAWDHLNDLAVNGTGRLSACAAMAVEDIREHRAGQAREALSAAGIFVGMDEFAIRAISQPRMVVQIDEKWRGDPQSLQWLRWLDGVENARIKGAAINREVLEHVIEIPGIQSVAIVEGEVLPDTLEPLRKMKRIDSLEFRYVALSEEQGDLIEAMPIRVSLNLMGTGISAQKVDSMRAALPGLQIDHRQGGFLGVTCTDGFDACNISGIVPDSAAEAAGLLEGDIVIQIEDTPIKRFSDLQAAINEHVPGDEIKVRFQRADKIESVKLRLRRFEES